MKVTLKTLEGFVAEYFLDQEIEFKSVKAYRTRPRRDEIEGGAARIVIRVDTGKAIRCDIFCFQTCKDFQNDINDGRKLHINPRPFGILNESELTTIKAD